jgi:hypothetical protein
MTLEEAIARNNALGNATAYGGGNFPAWDTTATVIPHSEPEPFFDLPRILADDAADAADAAKEGFGSIVDGVVNLPGRILKPILEPVGDIVRDLGFALIVAGLVYLLIVRPRPV